MDQAITPHRNTGSAPAYTPRGLILRIIMTLLTVAAAIWSQMLVSYQLPFHLHLQPTQAVLTPRSGIALPPGITAGDRAPYAAQSLRVRALLLQPDVPPSSVYHLAITHGRRTILVPIRSIAGPPDGAVLYAINLFGLVVLVLLGLVTLWRGRDWSAWGLSMLALTVLIGSAIGSTPLPPFGNLAAFFVQVVLTGPFPIVGLYLTANGLLGRTPHMIRRRLRAYYALLLILVICEMAGIPMVMLAAHNPTGPVNLLSFSIAIVTLAGPVLVLARGYFGAKPDQRLRIKWVLAATALLIPQVVLNFISQVNIVAGKNPLLLISFVHALLSALSLGIFAFAVLSARLVDVRIAINRAVVFTALMALVVGVLAVSESLIERSAAGQRTGLAIEVAVPLILGALFHQLQRRIEALVDRLFFRREHNARQALHEFVRDCGYIEQPEILVDRITETFARHAGGHGAALYEWRTTSFERSAGQGHPWPETLDPDDPALVRLRATLAPLDLHEMASALGSDGLALPLALRGRLFGVLICAPRSAGRYAQSEITELSQAAREIGASLFALRARANEALIERLAHGAIAPQEAHVQARQLIGLA